MKKLKSKNFQALSYYMCGTHAVFTALNNPKRVIENILCTKAVYDANSNTLNQYNYEIAPPKTLDKILGTSYNHQGIIAKVGSIFINNLKEITLDGVSKIAILDQITDPQNIGAIIRNAAAFGIEAIILPCDNSPNENALIAKAACGALESVKVVKVVNLCSTIEYLKKEGFWVVGLDSKARQSPNDVKGLLLNKVAIVLGSEDNGLRKLTKSNCDALIKIPMQADTESINVSSAAAIMFYLLSNIK